MSTSNGTESGPLATNRANWDERTQVHLRSRFYDVEGWLREGRGPRPREVAALGDVSGLSLLHLQCHIGLDTLAWARCGARVTGLDFSSAAIEAARTLAERAGLAPKARFVCADVHEAVEALEHARFDIVYVSLGALCWLPKVERWAEQVGFLVAPGGRFYLHDDHPLAAALADDQPTIVSSYFEATAPTVDDAGQTYTDPEVQLTNRRNYQWNHGIGEIVTALVRNGLQLEWLTEHDWTPWRRFSWLVQDAERKWVIPEGSPRFPLSFSILATRLPPAAERDPGR